MIHAQELVDFLTAMIDDYEQKYDVVVDRSEFDGEIVVPQHLRRNSAGGFLNHRVSSGILGSLTRSRTLLTMSGGGGGAPATMTNSATGAGTHQGMMMVHGSVPDLSRSSVASGGVNKGIGGQPLLEESSDYKLKESSSSVASGSDSALDVVAVADAMILGNNQKITKSRGKKLYAAKSTNYLFGVEEGVQLRRDSEEYHRARQSSASVSGGGDGFEMGDQQQQQHPSQLLKSFQSRNLSLDRPWNDGGGGSSPPPPPSRASSTVLLHQTNNQNNSHNNHLPFSSNYHTTQSHNPHQHYHYDPTRYSGNISNSNSNHSSHMKTNNNRPYMKSGSTNSISIMSVNNSNKQNKTPVNGNNSTSTTSTNTHKAPNSPDVRRWDEGRSSLSRRPNTFMHGLTNRSASTASLASIASSTQSSVSSGSRYFGKSSGSTSSSRAKQQLELQKMKQFNSYAAIGSLDRKNKRKSGDLTATQTMTLDRRPTSHVNNNNNTTAAGGGGGDSNNSSEVVKIRTPAEDKNHIESIEVGRGGLYKIPRPVMERTLSEQQREEIEQQLSRTDTGIEIVDNSRAGGQRIVLRSFGSSNDAQILFCESSNDGDVVALSFGEEDEERGTHVDGQDPDLRSLGVNDSAA